MNKLNVSFSWIPIEQIEYVVMYLKMKNEKLPLSSHSAVFRNGLDSSSAAEDKIWVLTQM